MHTQQHDQKQQIIHQQISKNNNQKTNRQNNINKYKLNNDDNNQTQQQQDIDVRKYKYINTRQNVLVYNPNQKKFYIPDGQNKSDKIKNILFDLANCKDDLDFNNKLNKLSGQYIKLNQLEDLAIDLQQKKRLDNNVYDLHYYKGLKGSFNVRYCILFVDQKIENSQEIGADDFEAMNINSLEKNDKYIHKFVFQNYGFIFRNDSSLVNYDDKFWVINGLNLMNYVDFAKNVGRKNYRKGLEDGFRGYDAEDFEHQALTLMPKAAQKFKYETSLQFQNYLTYYIRTSLKSLRRHNHLELDRFESYDGLIGQYKINEDKMLVDQLLESLPEREYKILKYFYGIDQFKEYTMNQIAQITGLSYANVKSLKTKGLASLQKKIDYDNDRLQEQLRNKLEEQRQLDYKDSDGSQWMKPLVNNRQLENNVKVDQL